MKYLLILLSLIVSDISFAGEIGGVNSASGINEVVSDEEIVSDEELIDADWNRFGSECEGGVGSSCSIIAESFPYASKEYYDFYRKACERGDSMGCNVSASRFATAEVFDIESYIRFYEMSCELGDMAVCANLGFIYETGGLVKENFPVGMRGLVSNVVEVNHEKSSDYYARACNLGGDSACKK